MNVDELIEKLQKIKEDGYGKLYVGFVSDESSYGMLLAGHCDIVVCDNGVGQYVLISK